MYLKLQHWCFISVCCLYGVKLDILDTFDIKDDLFNIYKKTAIKGREITNNPVSPEKITFYLFSKNNPDKYTQIGSSNLQEVANNVRIVFIIHGWLEDREREWYEDLKNAFLSKEDEEYYVVQVDWRDLANDAYTISSWNTKFVGRIIGEFIVDLYKNYGISLENILIVGHSLGGQISGYIGKTVTQLTSEKLPRIVALDPAGPLFTTRPKEERLNENDAKVVHVIHTDDNKFGFEEPCGTIDFFPNGGSDQPGCIKIDITDISSIEEPIRCDHERSLLYFIEAVLHPDKFVAKKCTSWSKFQSNDCKPVTATIGDLTSTETGNFYLKTNDDKPFWKDSDQFSTGEFSDLASARLKRIFEF